jgi:hypothetical protein
MNTCLAAHKRHEGERLTTQVVSMMLWMLLMQGMVSTMGVLLLTTCMMVTVMMMTMLTMYMLMTVMSLAMMHIMWS